jgi:hypothetical protein
VGIASHVGALIARSAWASALGPGLAEKRHTGRYKFNCRLESQAICSGGSTVFVEPAALGFGVALLAVACNSQAISWYARNLESSRKSFSSLRLFLGPDRLDRPVTIRR